jgi:hypothetical protein
MVCNTQKNVPETWRLSFYRWGEGDSLLGLLERVDVSFPSPEDADRSHFSIFSPNYLEFRTVDKVINRVILTLWSSILLGDPQVTQVLNNFTELYETRSFITVYIKAFHMFLTLARWIQSIVHYPIPLCSILILSSHLCILRHLKINMKFGEELIDYLLPFHYILTRHEPHRKHRVQ